MEEDLSRGAVNRHEYKRRRLLADIRMAEIERSLGPVKNQLSGSGARYQDMVRRVERAEADLQAVRVNLADLRNQYRSGRWRSSSLNPSLLTSNEGRFVTGRLLIQSS